MGQLVEGRWVTEIQLANKDGRFVRQKTRFRDRITADGSSGYPAEAGRYHLYVSYACPWAHRTLIMRKLKRLEGGAITLSVVDPFMGEDGWRFSDDPDAIPDDVNGARFLREIYLMADPRFTGRVTVPVLWDKQKKTIVNNESRDILRMLDTEFDAVGDASVCLCPPELEARIDETIDAIYEPINNGVYKAGFARKQEAYEKAVTELFDALDHWEGVLARQRYLCGDRLTEADICLFTTLVRFDAVYYSHFKCNLRRIVDYENLWGFLRDVYQIPGVAETVNMRHIKEHYYRSHESVNPTRIVPKGPLLDFTTPHGRQ